MKKANYFIYLILAFIVISCDKNYFPDGGIHFRVINDTENIFSGKNTLYIGAVKENKFIVTDSIISDILIDKRISSSEAFSETIIYGWRPDLDKVKNKSKNGIFLFKLSNQEQLFLNPFDFPQPTLDEAILRVYIEIEGMINYDDLNEDIRQDYEIIK